eukprot:UN18393
MHHSSALFGICAICLHYYPLDEIFGICTLILMIQHVFVILKYFHFRSYVTIEVMLEVWFEYETINRIPAIPDGSMKMTATIMLFSHWLFWTAAVIELFAQHENPNFIGMRP